MELYDLVVIGGGPAGTPVVMEYAKLNSDKKIALIESSGKLGGECLFQGCIPSKILEASAKYMDSIKEFKEFGVNIDNDASLIWNIIQKRKDEILNKRTNAAKNMLDSFTNVTFFQANGKFIDEKTIEVIQDNKITSIEFKKAVIGTGSSSFIPSYKGNGSKHIWTNADFFSHMQLPNSLSIIGSGAIAIEFSQILSSLGVKINLFIRGENILKNIDKEASEYLFDEIIKNENINVITNSKITNVDFDKDNDEFTITYMQENKEKTIVSQKMLSAAGRVANIDSLNLDAANVKYDKNGIIVSKALQTSNKNIYANGDVVKEFPKFAHTAQYGAHTIAQNLFLEHNLFKVNFDINSWVLFSNPSFMSAGISEEQANKRGLEVLVDTFDFSTEAKSQIQNEDYGYLKFIVEKSTNKIIGISALHKEAYNLGGEASLIIGNGLKLKDIINTIHPHPTISEAFIMLSKKMMGGIMLEKLKNPIIKKLLDLERWL